MPTNIRELKRQMTADFHPKAKVGPVVDILDEAHKAIADFLYRGLIGNTPVRTGRLAGGWTFSEIEGKEIGRASCRERV